MNKFKVALCIKTLSNVGGGGRSITELANELVNRRFEVYLITNIQNPDGSNRYFYDLSESVQLVNKPLHQPKKANRTLQRWYKNRFIFIDYIDKVLTATILGHKININTLSLLSFIRKYTSIRALLTSQEMDEVELWKQEIDAIKPDVVLSFLPHTFVPVGIALQHEPIPHLVTHWNDPYHGKILYNTERGRRLIHEVVRLSRFNLVQNSAFVPFFEPDMHAKTKVLYSPPPKFPSPPSQGTSRDKVILYVAAFRRDKNHEVLIRAFQRVHQRHPDWSLVIYGQSSGLNNHLVALIESLGLTGQVHLREPISGIYEQYQKAGIFAMPSLHEGFSRALIEAFSAGLPCVVVENCTSNCALVREGQFGLVASNTPESVAEQLMMLIENPDLARNMGENGARYAQTFDFDAIFDQWEVIIMKSIIT